MNRRRSLLFILTPLLLLGLALAFWQREDLIFYWQLYRAQQVGKQFYAEYPYLSRDVTFHPDASVTLDVYGLEGTGHPVLVFVHGGGWDKYDKTLFAPVAMRFVEQSIVTVIPDYTLYPHADYRRMAWEVAAALSWTLEHIQEYGGDPSRVVVAGHSAGGHLAALVATQPAFLQEFGHHPGELCGLVGLSGVYDVEAQMAFEEAKGSQAPVMTAVMGGRANFPHASPIQHVRPGMPRVLLIHGAQDKTVPASISQAFHQALQAQGLESTLILYPEAGHSDYLFDALSAPDAPVVQDVASFVHTCTPDVG